MVFSHSSTQVDCEVCGKTLVLPGSGKADIRTQILEIVG
ncbi:MAG: 30S ribosomal protein S27e [Candidatus Aenigmatarchaeota archaeon]